LCSQALSMPTRNILCTEAHPDDVVHAMGGTAWLLKDRYKLHILCATKGQRGIRGKSMDEAAAIREKEEAAACEMLGAELNFLGMTDGEVFAGPQVCERIAGIVRELEPVAVFTLWPINVADHLMAAAATVKALYMADHFFTTELYFYENGMGGQTNQFDPDLYVNISDVIDRKRELVRCHASQNRSDGMVEDVIERSRLRGKFARCDYAEGFKTPMPLMGSRWGRKAGSLLLEEL